VAPAGHAYTKSEAKASIMKRCMYRLLLLLAVGLLFPLWPNVQSQQKLQSNTVQVHIVITDEAVSEGKELPPLQLEDVKVKQGKNSLKVTQLIPATGENAALQLMILIDDTLKPSVGNNLTDLKELITAQPPSTVIAVGYMANAGVNVVQNFTPDHDLVVKALRLPRGSLSTMDSPYLSLISLVKSWPPQNVRRVVLMVSDGIDRLRGERPELSSLGPDYGVVYHRPNYDRGFSGATYRAAYGSSAVPAYQSMPSISIDAPSASEISQRYNVLVYSLYATGVGHAGRSGWDQQLGLGGLSQIADETGGECFSLGTSQLVSFKPYLEIFQKMLANQYYVIFEAVPKNKDGFQRVKIETELSNSEIEAPDNVWVAAAAR
jgi:hypothetical protein